MKHNKIGVLYTTIDTEEGATHLANLAISNNLAVCINIIPNGKSIYIWNSKIEQSTEYYMIFKTTLNKINILEKLIMENHPYDVPVILKFIPETSERFNNYIKMTF